MIAVIISILPNILIVLAGGLSLMALAWWATLEAEKRDDPWPFPFDEPFNMDDLNTEIQTTLSERSLTVRERANRATAMIGRQVGRETGGLVGAHVWGLTSVPRVPRRRWWHRWTR